MRMIQKRSLYRLLELKGSECKLLLLRICASVWREKISSAINALPYCLGIAVGGLEEERGREGDLCISIFMPPQLPPVPPPW